VKFFQELKMAGTRARPIAVFAVLAFLIPLPAFAYIDPGLGSLIFQGAIALFVAAAGAWAAFRMKLRQFFAKFSRDAGEDAAK
jgi:hypothetical protein